MTDSVDVTTDGGVWTDRFIQFGYLPPEVTGENWASLDLSFRLATNGVIVNTKILDEPIITTSAGQFNS